MGGAVKENLLSPEGQKDYEAILNRIPGFFKNKELMLAVGMRITNAGKSSIEGEKMKARASALMQKWSEDTTPEEWLTSDDSK
jgi:hypothetical protein